MAVGGRFDVRGLDEREVLGRAAGGDRAARDELVARNLDRVVGLVAAWRLPNGVAVPRDQRDDAVQDALGRLARMLTRFRGRAIGQLRAATARCVDGACRDACRRAMRHDRGVDGSLDAPRGGAGGDGDGGDGARYDGELARMALDAQAARDGASERLEDLLAATRALPDARAAQVVVLTMAGFRSAEIAERLDLTAANVDQLRSRGLRRLRSTLEAR